MIVVVGSKSPVKVATVKLLLPRYPLFHTATVLSVEVPSNVSAQPMGWDETILGAMNRASGAIQHGDFGVGIESGMVPVPQTKTGMVDICACTIFDGRDYHVGFSSAFEVPFAVMDLMQNEKLELNDAFKKAKLPTNREVSGVIESLTNGRLSRVAFTEQALMMALIHLEFPALYRRD